jgi:STE24 endopeptidase
VPEPLKKTSGLKAALAAAALVYGLLFVLTTFPASSEAEAQASRYFSSQEIETGLRFAFQRRLFFWAITALQLAFLFVVVFSGFARKLADFCGRLVPFPRPSGAAVLTRRERLLRGLHWLATVLLVGAFCFVAEELLLLPLRLGRFANLHAWNMTHRGVLEWLKDYGKWTALAALMGGVLLLGLYLLIRVFPRRWWAPAATATVLLGVCYAYLLPVVINPLFNTFTPLQDPYLQGRIRTLAARAGVPVEEVLVMDASRQGKHTNAYFTGFGSTRRIVLYDTLLKPLDVLPATSTAGVVGLAGSPLPAGPAEAAAVVVNHRRRVADEIESILAHEMGHWQHEHIVKGIALGALAAYVSMFAAAWILRWAVGRAPFGLRSPADPAGVPLLLLLSVLGEWLAAPVQNAVSRRFEAQADMAALQLTDRPEAFIEAEKRLARDNLSNVAPAPFAVWLFNSHPPAVERIRMAEEWEKRKQEAKSSP